MSTSEESSRAARFIFETDYWTIRLIPNQLYLGYCVVVLKRPCGDMAELTPDEVADFFVIAKKMEAAARQAFDATMFNWSCLMNLAYRNNPPDPQVHWHFRPRYNHPVKFADEIFTDPNFGSHYTLDLHEVGPEMWKRIIAEFLRFI
jgi:diadenosine tetraphosphate (Ap4A) HIT family hydrolase